MAVTQKAGNPYFFVTSLTPLLAGEAECKYRAWFKSRYSYTGADKLEDKSFNTAAWAAEHSDLVHERAADLKSAGYICTLEEQNWFRLHGKNATIGGKPDIVARGFGDAIISDEKTGKKKHQHFWQVLIYMAVMKRAAASKRPIITPPITGKISGEIVYRGETVIAVTPEELTATNDEKIFALVRELSVAQSPATTPSEKECGQCDIAACNDRKVGAMTVETDEI